MEREVQNKKRRGEDGKGCCLSEKGGGLRLLHQPEKASDGAVLLFISKQGGAEGDQRNNLKRGN